MKIPRSRLAPTPSGFLHLGNLANFALTWALVQERGGELLLRIDDVDATRARDEYVRDIHESLQWLGFRWKAELASQAAQTPKYRSWLRELPHYVCDCSRKSMEERGVVGHYDGHCREKNLSFSTGTTQIRLRASRPALDVVLWRKENLPSYHLASVVEDLEAQVTVIVRGEDLRESTEFQCELARALGARGAAFGRIEFFHHQLLTGERGEKLSKSKGALSLQALRASGSGPAHVWQQLGSRLGLGEGIRSLEEFGRAEWQKTLGP